MPWQGYKKVHKDPTTDSQDQLENTCKSATQTPDPHIREAIYRKRFRLASFLILCIHHSLICP